MIDVRHLTRRFNGTMALDDVSFEVHPGEIVALLGPNGAGKTTASRIIGGILAPSKGEVIVDGISVQKDANAVRARCGFVTDQPSLYERMTLRAYLGFFARLYDVTRPDVRSADTVGLHRLVHGREPLLAVRLLRRGVPGAEQRDQVARGPVRHEPGRH